MKVSDVKCGTCFFATPNGSQSESHKYYDCQRYPPNEQYEGGLAYPFVAGGDYCGEWRSRGTFQTIEQLLRS